MESSQTPVDQKTSKPGFARAPAWAQVLPFFLSAFYFLSALLAVLAPFPILYAFLKKGRKWGLATLAVNAVLIGILRGPVGCAVYFVTAGVLAGVLAELLKKRVSLEKTAALTFLSVSLVGVMVFGVFAQVQHFHPMDKIQEQISFFVDYFGKSVSTGTELFGPAEIDELKQSLLVELPWSIAVFLLVTIWLSLVLILRANPRKLRESLGLEATFWKKWKAPEFLVWPVIVSGVFLVWQVPVASEVALNVFRFLMAIYAIQGLSVLSYFFDLWNVKGLIRFAGFVLSLFFMMPLVLSLGFFDLWFDFRGKIRQT